MKKLLFITIFVFLVFPFVLTQGAIVVCNTTPCSWQDFSNTIDNLLREIVIIAFWIASLIVAIGAFFIMLGGLKPDWVKKGHSMIWAAIWAYVLVLLSGIIFDVILQIFTPQFKTDLYFADLYFGQKIVLAQTITPYTFYDPLRNAVTSSLNCGQGATPILGSNALGQLLQCLVDITGLLKNIAVILLVFAIIASAFYLIFTPLFGLKQISRAYKILIWSTIGLVIILLAEVIKAQIEKLI